MKEYLVEFIIAVAILALLTIVFYAALKRLPPHQDYRIINIEGCQYIESDTGGYGKRLIHKENCTNVIHLK